MTWHDIVAMLPILNLLLIPVIKGLWSIMRRIDIIEWNQKRICEHLKIPRISEKGS